MKLSFVNRVLGVLTALSLVLLGTAFGQGVTSSTLTGFVLDTQGAPIAGAAVTAVHTPTNTTFQATTNASGYFLFTGIPVGGPFTVTANATGYTIKSLTDVYTVLGQGTDVSLVGSKSGEEVVKLEKFNVTADASELDANATGAGNVLNNTRINAQPTASRAFADLIKTSPFVSIRATSSSGSQVEALGINNRYNTITLDGAKINDAFGLASTGLFSLNNPFSLDAIEQFSVSLTPYDVRQSGFAGASINAVSKGGTNEFHGSGYFIFSDANWRGKDVSGATSGTRPAFKERTYGFTFGGPILKDRLFFFTNFEKYYRDTAPTTPVFVPNSAFLSAINAKLATLPGKPDMGGFGGLSTNRLSDEKRLIKMDWNITRDHRLSVRYSDTVGLNPNTGSLNGTSFSQPAAFPATVQPTSFPNGVTGLSSNFYNLNVKEKVWASQLFSNWSSEFKTQFNYSSTKQDSVRDTPVKFPEIHIFNVPGISNNVGNPPISNGDAFRFGTEISSMGNELHIKTDTFGGSGDYVWGAYTFTAGADHEKTSFYNLFRQGSYGVFAYQDLAAFQADAPAGFMRSVVSAGLPTADISKFEQTGIFGQVKWTPTPRFNAMLGLRYDRIGSPIAPPENVPFKNAFGTTNSGTIDGTDNIAPRFSFNYALDQERRAQVRGGIGVFLGRNPWVWISNSYGNTGVGRFVNVVSGPTTPTLTQYLNGTYSNSDPSFKFDPNNPVGTTNAAGTASSINLIKPGLKLPTIERRNLALDYRLPFIDATVTVEYIQTSQLDALFVDNMNLKPTTVAIDGRQLWAGSSTSAPLVPGFANVIRTRDVHAGESEYASIGIDRPMRKGWAYNVSYTHGHATEAQTLNSSTANSQWQFNSVFNQNRVEVARSDYEIKHRVQASVSKELRYWKNLATTVSLYYEGRTGQPYSLVYANDLNNDGFGGNDLIAVPSDVNDKRFDFSGMTAAQRDAYFSYINSSGLGKYAGSYAPRNAFTTDWQNRLDLRVSQEIPTYKKVKLEVFADFINFGSFVSKRLFNYINEINTSTTNGGLTRSFGAATYGADGRIKPTFNNGTTTVLTVDQAGNAAFSGTSTLVPNNLDNRWQILGGVRLKF